MTVFKGKTWETNLCCTGIVIVQIVCEQNFYLKLLNQHIFLIDVTVSSNVTVYKVILLTDEDELLIRTGITD